MGPNSSRMSLHRKAVSWPRIQVCVRYKKNSVWNLSTTTLHDIFYSSLGKGSSVVMYNLEIDALTIYFDPRSKIIFFNDLNVQKSI
jgi:hypothetical protein